jgi:hypothetical protein
MTTNATMNLWFVVASLEVAAKGFRSYKTWTTRQDAPAAKIMAPHLHGTNDARRRVSGQAGASLPE